MPFPFCGKGNKEDKHEAPYGKGIEDSQALIEDKTRQATEQVEKYKNDAAKLKKDLDNTTRELTEKSKEVRNLEGKLSEYKAKLQGVTEDKERLENERVDLEKKAKNAANEAVDSGAISLSKGVSEKASKLESDLTQLQNVKAKIEEERDNAEKKVRELEETHKKTVVQLQTQVDGVKKEKGEIEARLKKEQQEAENKIKSYKHEKDTIENNLAHTKKQLELAQKESHIPRSPTAKPTDEWLSKLSSAEAELAREREQRLEKEKELTRIANEKEQLDSDKTQILQELSDMQQQADEMKKNSENALQSHRGELERMRADFQQKLSEKDADNDQLLTRLSELTAAEVLDGNPNVSDISDPNRPQKLGEHMSSLYDDQWTDASEELEKMERFQVDDGKAIVVILFDLLKAVYLHCKEASENQIARIEEHIFLPPLENPPSSPDTNGTADTSPVKSPTTKMSASKIPRFSSHKSRPTLPNLNPGKKTVMKGDKVPEIPAEVRRGIKEYRKTVAKQVVSVLEKEVFQKLRSNPDFGDVIVDACSKYISRAVEISWRMCVQDPPMVLKWDVPYDGTFNEDHYRVYQSNGSHVDYVAWPIIYMNEGGTILTRGVAEGKNSS